MSRQKDNEAEAREVRRMEKVWKVLEFGLDKAIKDLGGEFLGVAIRYHEYNSLMTVKVFLDGKYQVAFVGSDSIVNCFIKAYTDARREMLAFSVDKYKHPEG